MLGIISCFLSSADFFQNQLLQKVFREYHQSVKQLGSRSGQTKYLGPNCLQMLSVDDSSKQSVIISPYFCADFLFSIIILNYSLRHTTKMCDQRVKKFEDWVHVKSMSDPCQNCKTFCWYF